MNGATGALRAVASFGERSEEDLGRRLERITGLLVADWRPNEWFPEQQRIVFDPDHPLVALSWCQRPGCDVASARSAALCSGCRKQWREAGRPDVTEFAKTERLTRSRGPARLCVVERDAQRCSRHAGTKHGLCRSHFEEYRKFEQPGRPITQFLAMAVPMPDLGECAAVVCNEPVHDALLCTGHYWRWEQAGRPRGKARSAFLTRVVPNAHAREVSLGGLHRLAAAEVLYGLQRRDSNETKTKPGLITEITNHLRRRQMASVLDADMARGREHPLNKMQDLVRLAHSDPETERTGDIWDARVFGHPTRTIWDFSIIEQRWLRDVVKDYIFVVQTRRTPSLVHARLRGMGLLSKHLGRRADRGQEQAVLGRRDIEGFAVMLNREVDQGRMTNKTRCGALQNVRAVLADARPMGLLDNVPTTFAVTRDLIPPERPAEEPPSKALPECVIEQLSRPEALDVLRGLGGKPDGPLTAFDGESWVIMFETIRDTGRRPSEIASLRIDAVTRDHDGAPVLVYDNNKSARDRRRLPISEALHRRLLDHQQTVIALFPDASRDTLLLFPRVLRNTGGNKTRDTSGIAAKFRQWVNALDRVDGPDRDRDGQPVPFDRTRIYPYAFRYSYAQRHADGGTPVDVLRALMDHTEIQSTQVYYRVSALRKRDATDRLDDMRRDAHGQRLGRGSLSESARLRDAIGHIAVPFGVCGEPSNVQAGGQHCPIRYRCMGCGFFSSDPSFLPDLKAHLDELVRARERGEALGADTWALVPVEEINQLRKLIGHLETDLDGLPPTERELVERSCADLRTARRTVPVVIGQRLP